MSVITPEKSTTARINGAKSHGPTTPARPNRSSRNALRHGLSASRRPRPPRQSPPSSPPNPPPTTRPSSTPTSQSSPRNGLLETELVETMAAARWRLRRVSTIETTLLDIEMDRLRRIHRPPLQRPRPPRHPRRTPRLDLPPRRRKTQPQPPPPLRSHPHPHLRPRPKTIAATPIPPRSRRITKRTQAHPNPFRTRTLRHPHHPRARPANQPPPRNVRQ